MIPTSFINAGKKVQKRKKCWLRSDVRWGEGRTQGDGGVCLTIICHLCLDMKEGREGKKSHTQGPCFISMATWGLLSYLAIHYQRTCVDGEWDIVGQRKDGVLHFVPTAQPKGDGMNESEQNDTDQFGDNGRFGSKCAFVMGWTSTCWTTCRIGLRICSPSIISTGEITKSANMMIGIKTSTIQGWAISHWIK